MLATTMLGAGTGLGGNYIVIDAVDNRVNPPEAQDEIDLDSIVLRKRSSALHSGSMQVVEPSTTATTRKR